MFVIMLIINHFSLIIDPMSFFQKLFGQEDSKSDTSSPSNDASSTPCHSEEELLEHFGGIGLEKQATLYAVIGDSNWNVDMQKGEISFGTGLNFPIQVLGTFSHSSETWLWAWANTASGLSKEVTQQAIQLKSYGEENSIDLLTTGEFDAEINDLHKIGIIASAMFGSSGYYLANYGAGTMVVTIKSDIIDQTRTQDQLRILSTFPELISLFEMNHKNALKWYLKASGYEVVPDGQALIGTKDGDKISAAFDGLNRLEKLNG
jgi:hypothetical protein